jgi:hypothetical protein
MSTEMEHAKIEHLEARYLHLDDRVGRMSEDVSSVKATLGSVVDALNRLSSDLKPQPVAVATWIGVGLVILGMMGSMVWGIQAYVGGQVLPMSDRITAQEVMTRARGEVMVQQAYRNGRSDAAHEEMERRLDDIEKYGSRRWSTAGAVSP